MDVLEHLLSAPVTPEVVVDLDAMLARIEACPFEPTIDRALWSGFEADRLGYAFVGGYRAALVRLLGWKTSPTSGGTPKRGAGSSSTRLALAATEAGGAHPRAIATELVEKDGALRLRGEKTFVTLASSAEELLVVATRGRDVEGKNRLVLVPIRVDAPGVVIEDRAPTPFAPEVPHAKVTFDDVLVASEDLLPGDGYDVYLKPFRTIEDTHVLAATLGHVARTARANGFSRSVVEEVAALVLAVRHVDARAPTDPAGHVALAGVFEMTRKVLAEHEGEWNKAAPAVRDRWHRDQRLLSVAESARKARTAAAWTRLG